MLRAISCSIHTNKTIKPHFILCGPLLNLHLLIFKNKRKIVDDKNYISIIYLNLLESIQVQSEQKLDSK